MFEEIKAKLLEDSRSIEHILDFFGFDKIRSNQREIRCAFEPGLNPTAVVIRLQNNENLFVKDYERNISLDFINYLVKSKNIPFKNVMNAIKQELHLESIYNYKRKTGLFGGLYDRLSRPNSEIDVVAYPEEVLNEYGNTPNLLWLKEGISLETQRKWGVGYDVCSQRITLPIRTSTNEVMAVKGRANFELAEFEPKYLYLIQGWMSQTLFGYSENYGALYEGDVIIVESEKSVLKLDSWGYNNVVALGSNSLSPAQAKLIISLNPRSVIFMLDKTLDLINTRRNIDMLKTFCVMRQLEIKFWDWTENITLDDKAAPCDDTKDEFEYILKEEIKDEKELITEEDKI